MNSNMSQSDDTQNEENVSSICENSETRQQNRKRHQRHTLHQIQQLEEYFWGNPHPTKKQRNELGEELGMEPLQIKFWFQNKRFQMKVKHEHRENTFLRVENEKLQEENSRLRESLINACSIGCGRMFAPRHMSSTERQLRMENERLTEQFCRVAAVAANCIGKKYSSSSPSSSGAAAMFRGTKGKGKGKQVMF
ncbi:hypothetical protein ABFX02_13G028900 [Erythranthe guttata]